MTSEYTNVPPPPQQFDAAWSAAAVRTTERAERRQLRPATSMVGALTLVTMAFVGAMIFFVAAFSNIQEVRAVLLTYNNDDSSS